MPNIKTHEMNNSMIDHSPKNSKLNKFSKNPAATNPTAPVTKNIEQTVITRYKTRIGVPNFLYPSIMLVWVEFAYLDPYSKNGYFSTLTSTTKPIIISPKSAPALVDWIRWDTPIAVLAKSNPGPLILMIFDKVSIILFNSKIILPY